MRVAGTWFHQRCRRCSTDSTVAKPSVTLVATATDPSRAHRRQIGCCNDLPHQSQRARSTAQHAGGDKPLKQASKP